MPPLRAMPWPPRPCFDWALTGRESLRTLGRSTLEAVQIYLDRAPMAMGQSLVALDFELASPQEFAVIAGSDPAEFRSVLEAIYARFLPHKVVAPALAEQGACLDPKSCRFWRIARQLDEANDHLYLRAFHMPGAGRRR